MAEAIKSAAEPSQDRFRVNQLDDCQFGVGVNLLRVFRASLLTYAKTVISKKSCCNHDGVAGEAENHRAKIARRVSEEGLAILIK